MTLQGHECRGCEGSREDSARQALRPAARADKRIQHRWLPIDHELFNKETRLLHPTARVRTQRPARAECGAPTPAGGIGSAEVDRGQPVTNVLWREHGGPRRPYGTHRDNSLVWTRS
jgi:hypothetical protein